MGIWIGGVKMHVYF